MKTKTLLEGIKFEYQKYESSKYWNDLFATIRSESGHLNKSLTWENCKRSNNQNLNRYKDVVAYDHSRVFLPQINGSDYINGNYVELPGRKYNRRYILTQGPLHNTAIHFWTMVWTENTTCIVMVTKEVEKGKVKCFKYYPSPGDPTLTYENDDINFEISVIDCERKESYVKHLFKLTNVISQESRLISHYYYFGWPDFGVPTNPVSFLQFLWDVRHSGGLDNPKEPTVVHCSAGIGRSGTFVVIDLALLQIMDKDCEFVNLKEMIMQLRKCRFGIVQSPEQLRFIYMAVIAGGNKLLQEQKDGMTPLKFTQQDEDDFENEFFSITITDPPTITNDIPVVCNPIYDSLYNNSACSSESNDSDFEDNNDAESSACDQAAAAARNRRGLPITEKGFEESIIVNSNRANNENNIPTDSNSLSTTTAGSARQIIKEERVTRTQQMIEDIRRNMRQKDLERERWWYRIGMHRLTSRLPMENRNSVIVGASVMVGLVSFIAGYVFYRVAL